MIRQGLLLLLGTSFVACDAIDAAVVIHGVAVADFDEETGCTFTPDIESLVGSNFLDTAASYSLTLPFVAENNLAVVESDVGNGDEMIVSKIPNLVSPVRYSVKWECDNSAFSGGAFIVPHFDIETGFCYDQRADQSPTDFFGFDVVPVAGRSLAPTSLGVFQATVIPPEFGQHIDDAIQLATVADSCCIETRGTNCDGSGGGQACTELANLFATLDRNGELGLQVESDVPGEPSADIQRFRPFAVFDGSHVAQSQAGVSGGDNFGAGTAYALRQKGIFEVITTDGQIFQSSQSSHKVQIGRNMGAHSNFCEDAQGNVTGLCGNTAGTAALNSTEYCREYGNQSPPCRGKVFASCYNAQ